MKIGFSRRRIALGLALTLGVVHGLVPAESTRARCERPAILETLELERWRGKVVLLDFWASWCGPCLESFPWMQRMLDRYGDDGLVVVAVNVDEDRDAADAFLASHPTGFELRFDPEGCLPRALGVDTMPTSFLLDRDGKVVLRHAGFLPQERERYEHHIREVLGGDVGGDQKLADLEGASPGPKLGVRPWERSILALADMRIDTDPLDLALDDHIYFSKEASSGGRGFGGGGCGCN